MNSGPIKILLVEDSPGDARLIHEIFKESGASFDLIHRERLDDALRCLDESSFDIVLVDLNLPDSTGVDSFNHIYNYAPTVPVIVLTGLYDEELGIETVRAGAQDYLVKRNFDSNLLVRSVRYAVERKQTESKLQREEEKLRTIFDNVTDVIVSIDKYGKIMEVNNKVYNLTGYTRDELIGNYFFKLGLLNRKNAPEIIGLFKDAVTRGGIPDKDGKSFDKRYLDLETREGKIVNVEVTTTDLRKDGKLSGFLSILHDVTQQMRIEEQIRKSLKEKEFLLQELHHRVKNNMTVISSLLSLQANRTKDRAYRELMEESISRIKSMALVHDKLYRSEDLEKIDFGLYLKDLVQNMFSSYSESTGRITFKSDMESISLSIDKSIPCGLIINELISNSLKYAFPEGREGEITVSIHLKDKDEIEMIIKDNGIGMQEDLHCSNTKSLGLGIVNTLVKQLKGKIEINSGKGTKFRIKFRQ